MPACPDESIALRPGTRLCRFDDIAEGSTAELPITHDPDAPTLLLFRRDGRVHCYVNRCPHFNLPLNAQPNAFLILSDDRIMCAHHCATFRIEDGLCIDGPAKGACLEAVPVTVRGADVVLCDLTDETP